ncbi:MULTISPECIES: hypothetical protein [Terrabacteria group]|uniref:hypothetical protein n=1 Tax=Bacillati TaxID=1783272 RepID=UPI00362DECF6
MSAKVLKKPCTGTARGTAAAHSSDSLQHLLASMHLRLTADDLVAALEALQRNDSAVDLPAPDRDFRAAHSGITHDPSTVASGPARNAAAQVLMDSSSLTAAEVAENLNLSPFTVRHYKAERKLYSYLANGRLLFPTWQFRQQSPRPLPELDRVLERSPMTFIRRLSPASSKPRSPTW